MTFISSIYQYGMKMNQKNQFLLSALSALIISTSTSALAKDKTNKLNRMYSNSVEDAVVAEQYEISNALTVITPNNDALVWNEDKSKLLVVTWKSQDIYDNYIAPYTQTSDSEKFVTWVTAVPEVKNFCQSFAKRKKAKRLDLRLKQHLGLNHTWSYDVFVELWVSPDDLFRPCTDPEINDSSCNLNFGDSVPAVRNITNYKQFYQNLYYSSFRAESNLVPWTGLGYTYDWANNQTDIGASEFILVPSATYEIHKVTSTAEYCQ